MKRAKSGHFYVLLNTPTPRRMSERLGVELRLRKPKAKFSEFSDPPRCRNPALGVVLLRLGQATTPVLFSLRLILESVTLLFELSMEDI